MDFDDLLLLTEELFRLHEDVRRDEAGRYDHVLVDEYQDTNQTQYSIIKQLAGGHRNLCVVGDDDQSIYGWRGAEVQHILNFRRDWPEANEVRLEANYRSTAAILEFANRLIAFNKTRHDKVLRAARAGAIRLVFCSSRMTWRRLAVSLTRSSESLIAACTSRRISPFSFGPTSSRVFLRLRCGAQRSLTR